MSELQRLNLRLQRRPWTTPAVDDELALRRWVREHAARRFLVDARLPELLLFFGDDFVEEVEGPDGEDVGQEGALAAAFLNLGDRGEIKRRFRIAELWIPEPDEPDQRRRVIAVAEPALASADDEGQWWIALRRAAAAQGGGGTLAPSWTEIPEASLTSLSEPLREWLDPGDMDVERATIQPRHEEDPPIHWVHATLNQPLPDDAIQVAGALGQMLAPELLRMGLRKLPRALVFTFCGHSMDRYASTVEPALGQDDFLRGLASQGPCEVAARVEAADFRIDGAQQRGFRILVERDGQRAECMLPVALDAQGGRSVCRGVCADLGPVSPEERWIESTREVRMEVEDAGLPVVGGVVIAEA